MTDGRATSEMRMTASGRFDPIHFCDLNGCQERPEGATKVLAPCLGAVANSGAIPMYPRYPKNPNPLRHSSQP